MNRISAALVCAVSLLVLIGVPESSGAGEEGKRREREIVLVPERDVYVVGRDINVRVQFLNHGKDTWTLEQPERSGWVGFDGECQRFFPGYPYRDVAGDLNDPEVRLRLPGQSWSLGKARVVKFKLPDGVEVAATSYELLPDIEIRPGGKYEFKYDLYQPRGFVRTAWRPGPWKWEVKYRDWKPDRIRSAPVDLTLIVTADSIDYLIDMVKDDKVGQGQRNWAGDILTTLHPEVRFDWPWYTAKAVEREAATKHNRREIAKLEKFWKGIKGRDGEAAALRGMNARFGVREEILEKFFGDGAESMPDREP